MDKRKSLIIFLLIIVIVVNLIINTTVTNAKEPAQPYYLTVMPCSEPGYYQAGCIHLGEPECSYYPMTCFEY